MRGDFTLKLLENIRDFACDSVTLVEAFLDAGYGASVNKILGEFDKRSAKKARCGLERTESEKLKHRFYSMLNKLERDGLITKSTADKLKLTRDGERKIHQLKEMRSKMLPFPAYSCKAHGSFVIVIFDIPERDKRKRDWLRVALRSLNFKMLQKSVWLGKVKIPTEFINDLKTLKIVECVEVFEISKGGTLQQII